MDRDQMRASESDRQVVMERLRQAVEEGRLDVSEYQDRVDAAMQAKVYSELDILLSDLQQLPPPGYSDAVEPTTVMPSSLSKANQQLRDSADEGSRKWKIAGVAIAIAAVLSLILFAFAPELFLYIAIAVLVILVLFVVAAVAGLF
jgi:VIT1/CCC1 family predicted Fe2+/Mn2+ transporter